MEFVSFVQWTSEEKGRRQPEGRRIEEEREARKNEKERERERKK